MTGFVKERHSVTVVLLSSTKIMTKYRRQRTFITWRNETRRNVNAGHVTMTIIKCIMQYRWRIKTRLNVVYKIKTMLKMSLHFRWLKRDETKCYNVISSRFVTFPVSHFRGWNSGLLGFRNKTRPIATQNYPKTIPIAFRGGFPGKVRIPGTKYHVIGVASTRGH